jgi:hypothetical protein
MRRISLMLLVLMLSAGTLVAQRRPRIYSAGPDTWVSGSIAGFRANGVNDGTTGSTWDFGNSTNLQYRLSLEKGMSGGLTFGVAGSYANVPFVYQSDLAVPLPAGVSGTRCNSAGCNAHLNMMTVVGTLHYGSGLGLHQVVELGGGIISYQNLVRESDGAKLAGGGNIDPLFSLDYGFGYGVNDRTAVDVVWDYGIALHERNGLSNGVSNTNTMPGLRVQMRMGFGGRTIRR